MIKMIKNKTKLSLFLPIALISMFISSCNTDDTQTVANFSNLVIEDQFNVEGVPDASLWAYDIGRGPNNDGWGNQELQYYTEQAKNVRVSNGLLLITAHRESFEGAEYTSARIVTRGKFEQAFGRFEARIRIPFGEGVWPAFWLLGNDCDVNIWPQCGEIDIMENFGRNASLISSALHGPGYSAASAESKGFELSHDRYDNDFHIYGVEWSPSRINFYVDSSLYHSITPNDVDGQWVFDHPFYIIINLAVGGNAVGDPANTQFPKTMAIDYIRVYEE